MSRRKAAAAGGPMEMEEEKELRRGPWTLEEDNLLMSYIACNGEGRWNLLARCSGLKRTGKSCRLRWLNYLKPDIKRGNLTPEEQLLILELHSKWGNRWSRIAQHLPGRTDNEIKNYWRTRVQKQARQLKVDANSTVFRDAVRCYWMPRLLEKMASASASSAAHHQVAPPPPMQPAAHGGVVSSPISSQLEATTTHAVVPAGRGSCCQYYYPVDPSASTSTSGSTTTAALLPPVPCFSELNWDQYYSGELDGAPGVFDSALLGSLGLDGLDLGQSDLSDSTLLDYLNSSCTANAMTMMMSGGNYYNYCGGVAMDGDHGSTTYQAAKKLGEWGGGI